MKPIHRIECIDISNTMGMYATGSLVVLIDGLPSNSDYRRFKIRTKEAPNDFAMVAEVLRRRLKHTEWDYPELLLIDGGKGQVGMAQKVLNEANVSIPIIGLAKRFEEIIVPVGDDWKTLRLPMSDKGLQMLMRIRDESHRFALRYHRLLRSRAFLPKP
jgi:excinuclease ABC subunit C